MQLRLIINDATRRLDQRLRDWVTSFNSVGVEIEEGEILISHLSDEVTDLIGGGGATGGTDGVIRCGDRISGTGEEIRLGSRV